MQSRTQWNADALATFNNLPPATHQSAQERLKLLEQGKTLLNELDFPLLAGYRITWFADGTVMLFHRQRQPCFLGTYMVITVEDIAPTAKDIMARQLFPKEHTGYIAERPHVLKELSDSTLLLFSKQTTQVAAAALVALIVSSTSWLIANLNPMQPPSLEKSKPSFEEKKTQERFPSAH